MYDIINFNIYGWQPTAINWSYMLIKFIEEFEKETGWNKEKIISPIPRLLDYTGMSFYAEYENHYVKWLETKLTNLINPI